MAAPALASGGGHRLLRPDRGRLRLQPGRHAHPGPAATEATGCSTAPRCGSPTATSPMWPPCGRRPMRASAGSWSPPTPPDSAANTIHKKLSCGPRSPRTGPRQRPAARIGTAARSPRPRLRYPCLNEARFSIVFGVMGAAWRRPGDHHRLHPEPRRLRPPAVQFPAHPGEAGQHDPRTRQGRAAGRPGRIKDAGAATPEQVSLGKLSNAREAIAIAREWRLRTHLLGGSGITLEYSPLRHANNLESVLTYEAPPNAHALHRQHSPATPPSMT